jgi:peptidoglycan hydrolase CwlO-like protein
VLRMEARISAAHAKIEVMQKQRDEDRKEGDKVRAEIKEALADLYREMKSEMGTIQADIKLLLREHGK